MDSEKRKTRNANTEMTPTKKHDQHEKRKYQMKSNLATRSANNARKTERAKDKTTMTRTSPIRQKFRSKNTQKKNKTTFTIEKDK